MANKSESPKAGFQFIVNIGDKEFLFQEITGLNMESQTIEYGNGDKAGFSARKLPSLRKSGNVTLKRGVVNVTLKRSDHSSDQNTVSFLEKISQNKLKQPVTISMLDETNAVVMRWKLSNAFPVKIESADLKSDSNEVAIETMELSHEGLEVSG